MHSPARVLSVVAAHSQRIILILLLSLVAALPLALPIQALAQSTTTSQKSYMAPNVDENVPQNQHTYVQSVFIETLSTAICFLGGIDVINQSRQCLTLNPQTHKLGYITPDPSQKTQVGGIVGISSQMISSLYRPPASGSEYIHYLASNFGIVKHTYAVDPGKGFEGLGAVQTLWKSILNVTYLFFILIFVIIGMAIMLRLKLDGKTAATLQSQIPKIIITIILATFSFAIAGFLIDIMWTFTYFGINLLTGAVGMDPGPATIHLLDNPLAYAQNLFSQNFGAGLAGFAVKLADSIGHILESLVRSLIVGDNQPKCNFAKGAISLIPVIGGIGSFFFGGDGSIVGCVQTFLFGTAYWIASVLGFFIVLAAIVITLFKVWLSLLKAYAYILLDIILAPLYILGGLIPNSSLGFTAWIRHLAANLFAFPTTAILFLIADILATQYDHPTAASTAAAGASKAFIPPFVGNPNFNFGAIIGFALLLITPEAVNLMKDAFKAADNKRAGSAITAGIAAGAKPAFKNAGKGWSSLTRQSSAGQRAGILRSFVAGTPRNYDPDHERNVYNEHGHVDYMKVENLPMAAKRRFKLANLLFGGGK